MGGKCSPDSRTGWDSGVRCHGCFDQVEQLLFEMVMVYVKFMEQSGVSVTPKKVKKQVSSLAKYVYTKYHPLRRQKFEGEEMYFSRMLNNYVSAKRFGVI